MSVQGKGKYLTAAILVAVVVVLYLLTIQARW